MTKQALDPRISAALQLGLLGAGGGLAFQGVRKMLQGRDDEEENGSPSLLRGALTGGLLGAAGGGGLAHLLGLHEGGAPSAPSTLGMPSQGLGADLAGAAPKHNTDSAYPGSLTDALQDPSLLAAAAQENGPTTLGARNNELSNAYSGSMRVPFVSEGRMPTANNVRSRISITDLADQIPAWQPMPPGMYR